MSDILPYFCTSLLLLAVTAKWALQILKQRSHAQIELVQQLKRTSRRWDAQPRRDLAERIFDSRDWKFVSRYTSLEIRKAFQKERALLAISWLQRAKSEISLAMQQHRKATRHSHNLELYTETKLVLTHFFFALLCHCLITLIWFHGAFATRRIVLEALHLNVRLHSKFEDLILVVGSASQVYSDRNFERTSIATLSSN
jgi:hypothetical protein